MLSNREIARLVEHTQEGTRNVSEHTFHASFEASRAIAHRMKISWRGLGRIVEREHRLQMAGVDLRAAKTSRDIATMAGSGLEITPEEFGLNKKRALSILRDVRETYHEQQGRLPPKGPVIDKVAGALALVSQHKWDYLSRNYSPQIAEEFQQHTAKALMRIQTSLFQAFARNPRMYEK